MFLYLIQHGEARPEEEDPKRSLSDKGRKDVEKISKFLENSVKNPVDVVYHSKKERAKETAQGFSALFRPVGGVSETDGLAPLDNPKIWAERLKNIDKDTVLVGHLPHMALLASLLIGKDANTKAVDFKMGGVLCLIRHDEGWAVEWMVVPEMLG